MNKYRKIFILFFLIFFQEYISNAQIQSDFKGQLSWLNTYSNAQKFNSTLRYIPEYSAKYEFDSIRKIDFESSFNFTTSYFTDSGKVAFNPSAYRLWVRYSTKQSELRLGLQKIDFGSATLLRPLQWFNRIDPRDPLRITNGVKALLGRYYFVNNANLWIWGLLNNTEVRGMDIFSTKRKYPEVGGRLQLPVPKGEIAFTYHHRTGILPENFPAQVNSSFAENRIGFDTKLDLIAGIWVEGTSIFRNADLGSLRNQTTLTLGTDYTFGLGSGLNLMFEKMWVGFGEKFGKYQQNIHLNALVGTYPININNRISVYGIYSKKSEISSLVGNFEHQFNKITAYLMFFHNRSGSFSLLQNQMGTQFNGKGFNILLIYNH
ncbi:MAG: hypothetical protein LCH67_00520 [Bacteroidetes bacterium]|nr:hypothetical protein [Bacteroidota bacterium]